MTPVLLQFHSVERIYFVRLLLGVPAELENQHRAALGYVDVTQGPFRADPTGKQDSTQAVQAAVLGVAELARVPGAVAKP